MFGIPIQEIQEIIGARPLTRIFRAHPAVGGVTSLRGEILPVLELSVLLGLQGTALVDPGGEARIVVVREPEGARRRAGLRVDGLGPVRELPRGVEGLDPVPATVAAKTRALLRGVLSEPPLCAVLDVRALLDAPELLPLSGRA